MDPRQAQRLHDTLSSRMRKGKGGLGMGMRNSYNFPGVPKGIASSGTSKATTTKAMLRPDGLPCNALYANFVREGGFADAIDSSNPYGDGRVIKRNFDDCCSDDIVGKDCSSIIAVTDDGEERDTSSQRETRKSVSKTEKKEKKRQAKRAAKLAAKIEEKKALKRAEKLAISTKGARRSLAENRSKVKLGTKRKHSPKEDDSCEGIATQNKSMVDLQRNSSDADDKEAEREDTLKDEVCKRQKKKKKKKTKDIIENASDSKPSTHTKGASLSEKIEEVPRKRKRKSETLDNNCCMQDTGNIGRHAKGKEHTAQLVSRPEVTQGADDNDESGASGSNCQARTSQTFLTTGSGAKMGKKTRQKRKKDKKDKNCMIR